MSLVRRVVSMTLVLAFVAPALAGAGQATPSATEFYQAYRKAFAKAQKIEDLLPMMATSRRAEVEKSSIPGSNPGSASNPRPQEST